MAIEKTLNTRIKLRIDTHEAWMLNDPVLLDGEIAIATLGTAVEGSIDNVPSVAMKVGQQNKKYSELDFMYARAADVLKACKKEADLKAFVNNVIKEAGLATDATIVEINADIDALEKALGALTTRVETAEGKITALETASATHALKSEVEAVDAKFADYTKTADLPKDLGDFTNNAGYAKTADVNTELGKKADKTQVAADIASAITASENKEDAKFANYRKAADQDAIDATFATKTELANEKKALQDEIDADVKVVANDLAGYKTTNDATVALKADKTQVEADIAAAVAPLATTEALNGVDAKFADYKTAAEQKLVDEAQDFEINNIKTKIGTFPNPDLGPDVGGYVMDDISTAIANIARAIGGEGFQNGEMGHRIADNASAIANINDEATGILAQAKLYADGKDTAIANAHQAGTDAQNDVNALEAYVGTFTASEGVETVVDYIDAKTANIASDERVSGIDNRVIEIEKDYLKAADKTALQEQITANANAISVITEGVDADKIDGLKDLIDWADEHAPEVASIKEDIEANTKAIGDEAARADAAEKALDGRLNAIEPKVAGWDATKSTVDANKETWDKAGTALQAADLADYAKTADVVTNDEFTAFEATNTAAIQAAKKAGVDAAAAVADDVDALTTTMTQVESVLGSYMENSPHPGGIPAIIGDYTSVSYGPSFTKATIADDLATVVSKLGPDVWGKDASVGERISALEAIDHDFASADAALKSELQGEIDADVEVVSNALAEYKTSNDAALAGVKTTADSAVQSVAAGDGLKATREGNAVTIAFDDAVTFIFDCGTSK